MATHTSLRQFSLVEQLGLGIPAGYKDGSVMWKKTPSGDFGGFPPPSPTSPLISSPPIRNEFSTGQSEELMRTAKIVLDTKMIFLTGLAVKLKCK